MAVFKPRAFVRGADDLGLFGWFLIQKIGMVVNTTKNFFRLPYTATSLLSYASLPDSTTNPCKNKIKIDFEELCKDGRVEELRKTDQV